MGPVTPFIPLITTGVGLLAKKFGGGKGGGVAGATGAQTALTRQLAGIGTGLTGQGQDFLNTAGGYYSQLAGKSRSAIQAGLAPEMGAIGDIYRGASRGLDRSGVRGPTRDMAEAELGREQAGRLAALVPGTRARANEALANLGTTVTGQGLSALGGAGGGFQALAQGARVDRARGDAIGNDLGQTLGTITAEILKNWKK